MRFRVFFKLYCWFNYYFGRIPHCHDVESKYIIRKTYRSKTKPAQQAYTSCFSKLVAKTFVVDIGCHSLIGNDCRTNLITADARYCILTLVCVVRPANGVYVCVSVWRSSLQRWLAPVQKHRKSLSKPKCIRRTCGSVCCAKGWLVGWLSLCVCSCGTRARCRWL